MGYIFTKANAFVAIVFAISFGLSISEVVQWANGLSDRNQQLFIAWQQRSKSRYKSQTECQQATQAICNYETCDYVPVGKTIEEVCGVNFEKGWKPSMVPIPQLFQYMNSIRLKLFTQRGERLLILSPPTATVSYTASGPKATVSEKKLEMFEITLLSNKFILYDFQQLSRRLQQEIPTSTEETIYQFVITGSIPPGSGDVSGEQQLTATCSASTCPREFIDLKNDVLRLWREPIPEE